MKTLLATLVAIAMLIFAFSCKKSDDKSFAYSGHWTGTYTGTDAGTWQADITDDGKFTGTAASNLAPTYPFAITGTVSDSGHIEATYSLSGITANFMGQITGNNASGTWAADSLSVGGTWSGVRK